MRFLGDFHTHPYRNKNKNAAQIQKEKLYEFSKADFQDIEENSAFWKKHGYKVGIVCTIVDLERESRTDKRFDDSTLITGFGNYKLWIKAYYAAECEGGKIKLSDDLYLSCHPLHGMIEYNDFGRHKSGKHQPGDL